jgi:hypothetical protein
LKSRATHFFSFIYPFSSSSLAAAAFYGINDEDDEAI